MFQHALESFEHGLEHYLDGTERSRKFALLHLDHAIELILKEKCVQCGKSIYKGDGSTLTIHEAFKSLANCSVNIPEQPRLEELHDLRNTVQHKGLIPDALTTQFLVEIAYGFIKRFLGAELTTPLDRVLPRRYRVLLEAPMDAGVSPSVAVVTELGVPMGRTAAPEAITNALANAYSAENPSSKIISGYGVLEAATRLLGHPKASNQKIPFRKTLIDAALANGATEKKLEKQLYLVFMLRSQLLHGGYQPTEKDAVAYLTNVTRILNMVGYRVSLPVCDPVKSDSRGARKNKWRHEVMVDGD